MNGGMHWTRVLPVPVHGQGVREATLACLGESVVERRALAAVSWTHRYAQLRVGCRHRLQRLGRAIVLPSTTTHTGAHCARAARTASIPRAPGL